MSQPLDTLKIILIGDSEVGKTNLLLQFCDGSFTQSNMSTIGIDFRSQVMQFGDTKYKVQLWDTAGQERFRTITRSYLRGAHAIMLVYDHTSIASFENIQQWLTVIRENAAPPVEWGSEQTLLALVGNKTDLPAVVPPERAQAFADEMEVPLFLTSAKTGSGVRESFTEVARRIVVKKQDIRATSGTVGNTATPVRISAYPRSRRTQSCASGCK